MEANKNKTAAIVGLGLIGGSCGIALKELGYSCVYGFDKNELHQQIALSSGLVDECMELEWIFANVELIFISVPVEASIDIIKNIKNIPPQATIIELGGVKNKVRDALELWQSEYRANFVLAHQMSGTEFFGPKAAKKDLFKDALVIFVDFENSGEFQQQRAREVFLGMGMSLIKMSCDNHDRHVALISHLPHIVSFSLANCVLSQENPQTILALIGGGFRSMSRLSKSSPIMWRDVFKQNKDNMLTSIDIFEKELSAAKKMIENDDWELLQDFMANANNLYKFIS